MNSESGREARAPALLARRRVVCVRACVRAFGRDLVDCWSEKTFRWSKCKGTVEVAADE